jgi:spermidine/putrescine transport system permease protein
MDGARQESEDTAVIAAFIDRRIVPIVLYGSVVLALLLFYLPVLTLIGFSFRAGRHLVLPFDGVTLAWYASLFDDHDFLVAAWNSFLVATVVTVVCTQCGTLLANALVRFGFRFRTALAFLTLSPILFPQLLLGIVLLLWFAVLGNWLNFSLGLVTAIAGHVVYILPFAAIVVAVRLISLDPQLDDAARDCGASTWQVYRHVRFPLLLPGILSAAIFSFLLSWSNFYISFNLSGTTSLLPTYVYAGLAFNSSPAYPAIATIILVPMVGLVVVAEALRRRSAPKPEAFSREAYA